MGVVYLIRNLLMDRPEVLKLLHKSLVEKPGSAERFLAKSARPMCRTPTS